MSAASIPGRASDLVFASPASTTLDELVHLRAVAEALHRRARRSRAPLTGAVVSRRLGRGLDFAETRIYQPGDDVRMIDWRVTARSGRAHTKLFVEERERPILLVIDCRSGMRFGTRGMYKSVLAARLAAILGWSAVAARDRVGGFVLTDDWHAEVRPRSGRRGLMALFRAVVQAQHHVPGRDRGQFGDSLARLRHVVQPGSTVIILSDFAGFDDVVQQALGGLMHSLDLQAVHISDPLECELPPAGTYPVISGVADSARRVLLGIGGRTQRERHAKRFEDHVARLASFFARGGNPPVAVSTAEPLIDAATRVLTRAPVKTHAVSARSA